MKLTHEANGKSVTVSPVTPKTILSERTMVNRVYEGYEKWAEDTGFDKHAVDSELSRFITVGSRVVESSGDIEFASFKDTTEELFRKFNSYVEFNEDQYKFFLYTEEVIKQVDNNGEDYKKPDFKTNDPN